MIKYEINPVTYETDITHSWSHKEEIDIIIFCTNSMLPLS